MDISEQKTAPIRFLQQANTFHDYLVRYGLTWVAVARASGVTCATVWLIDQGKPVLPSNAVKVRQGAYRLTGVAYTGPIEMFSYEKMLKRR